MTFTLRMVVAVMVSQKVHLAISTTLGQALLDILDELVAVAGDDEQGRAILDLLAKEEIDIITFTSSSTVRNFMQWLTSSEEQGNHSSTRLMTANSQLKIASIGPITSQTARELGLTVHIEALEFTIEGLVEAIVRASLAAHTR